MDHIAWDHVYYHETLATWLKVALLLLSSFLLSPVIANIIMRLFRKLGDEGPNADAMITKLTTSIRKFVTVQFWYAAFHQLTYIPSIVLLSPKSSDLLKQPVTIGFATDHLFSLLSIILLARVCVNLTDYWIGEDLQKSINNGDKTRAHQLPYIKRGIEFVIWLFAIIAILAEVLDVNVPALIASLGIGGVALALAAKESVENTLASFVILLDKPFQIGETIKVGGVEGIVEHIGFRSSRIRTAAQTVVIVPNKSLINEDVENLSERGKQKMNSNFALPYGTSEAQLKKVIGDLHDFLNKNENILSPVSVYLSSFNDYALQITVGYFVKHPLSQSEINNLMQMVNMAVYKTVYAAGCSFAIPVQMSLEPAITAPQKPTNNAS